MLLLTLRETNTLNRLSGFQNLRRKGGKFDHRPERPKVLLRQCLSVVTAYMGWCADDPRLLVDDWGRASV